MAQQGRFDGFMRQAGIQFFIKRLLDLGVAIMVLLFTWPLLVVIALLIRIGMGRPVLFRQQRPGHREQIFTLYKFRTMTDSRDENGNLLPDQQRLTVTGRLVRSLSLDELPQAWNILKGEMSLVGPRALLVEYLDRYSPEQRRRHDALPGITGWAQINGRNLLSWEEKFEYDVWYVDNWSLWLDIRIILVTVWKVLKREGISQEGQATMQEFMGSGRDGETGL